MAFEVEDTDNETGLRPGTIVAGRFRVTHKLGEGGMGAVYAAVNLTTNRTVALKVLHAEYVAKKDIVRRFMREAKAATAIRHPNVIEVLDVVDTEAGEPVMVMELLEGEPLDELLQRQGALPLGDVARIMIPVVAAVGVAHARGIIHRDLKPENIFLARIADGTTVPKVLDFGIAKVLDPNQINELATKSGATRTGSMLGTPHYMSIEQACGEKDIDHRTDLWSIGVILYVMLAGRRPYEGDNYGQILKGLMTTVPAHIATLVPSLPQDVADVVMKCMGRARADRPYDLREVHLVLSRYCADFTVPSPPSVAGALMTREELVSGATLAAASVYTSHVPHTRAAPPASRAGIVAGVAVTFVLIGAGLTWAMASRSGAKEPTVLPETPPSATSTSVVAIDPAPSSAVPPELVPAAPATSAAVAVLDSSGVTPPEVPSAKPPKDSSVKSIDVSRKPPAATASAKPAPPATNADEGKRGGIIESLPY